jgi:hypothetical protein
MEAAYKELREEAEIYAEKKRKLQVRAPAMLTKSHRPPASRKSRAVPAAMTSGWASHVTRS